jgi:putative SOS response-associated peptidase YedK
MCGRFTQLFTWQELHDFYALIDPQALSLEPSWNIAPTQEAGVVVREEQGFVYRRMRWGLVPMWAKDMSIGNQAINARVETAAEKPVFRGAWKSRRCVVPASGFYEWRETPLPGKSQTAKSPFYIARRDGRPLTFAGLWERWKDGMLSFTILTQEACASLSDLHSRMPVMLAPEAIGPWLGGANPVCEPRAGEALRIVPVSPKMGSPRYNEPGCIEALPPAG